LKNNRKLSIIEMLQTNPEPIFQYYMSGENMELSESKAKSAENIPSIKTIKLAQFQGSKTNSNVLATELSQKIGLPQNLLPALCAKIRIAKFINSSELDKYNIILASLLSYNILCIFLCLLHLV